MQLQRWTLCLAIAALSGGCPLDITVTAHEEEEPPTSDDGTDDGYGDDGDDSADDGDWAADDGADGDGGVDWECYDNVFRECVGDDGSEPALRKNVEKCGDGCSDDDGDDIYTLCDEVAIEQCTIPSDGGSDDGWCGTDDEEPEPDCFTTVYEECIASGGCEEDCLQFAEESCHGEVPPEDPPVDDCFTWIFELCIADGGSEEECLTQASESCDPGTDEPVDDCVTVVYGDCLAYGGAEEECKQLAADSCVVIDDPEVVVDVPEKNP
jgi:hypothetical protein